MSKPSKSARRTARARQSAADAKARAERRRSAELLLGEEIEPWATARDVSYMPTSRLYRTPGGMQHKGAEVAKLQAQGHIRTVRRDRDASGPLREDVGCTVRTLDYRQAPSPSRHRNGD